MIVKLANGQTEEFTANEGWSICSETEQGSLHIKEWFTLRVGHIRRTVTRTYKVFAPGTWVSAE